jgi:hypothetical protein
MPTEDCQPTPPTVKTGKILEMMNIATRSELAATLPHSIKHSAAMHCAVVDFAVMHSAECAALSANKVKFRESGPCSSITEQHNFILIEILEFIPHGFHSRYQHITVLNIRLTLLKVQVWPKELQGRTGRKCSSFIHDIVERHSSTNDIGTCTVLLGASCGCISVCLERRSQPALLASRHNNCLSVSIPLDRRLLFAGGTATASLRQQAQRLPHSSLSVLLLP